LAAVKLRNTTTATEEKYFKAPGGLITPAIGIAAIIWLLTSLGKWEILSTLIFIAVIIAIYFTTKWLNRKRKLVEIN